MTKFLPILIVLLLAACTEATAGSDPFADRAAAQALQAQADARIAATQDARMEYLRQATLSAAATKGAAEIEMQLIQKQIDGTQNAYQIANDQAKATQEAASSQAEATSQAAATATSAAITAIPLAATQAAIQRQARIDDMREQSIMIRQRAMDVTWTYGVPIGLIMIAVLLLRFADRLMDWIIEWRDRKASLYETRQGTVAFIISEDGNYYPQLLANRPHLLPYKVNHNGESQADIVELTSSGSVLASPVRKSQPDGITIQAVQLLRDAIRLAGDGSQVIPGWRDLPGWSSDRWQRVIAGMTEAGLVVAQPGKGTFIANDDLGGLLYRIEMKLVKIRPALPRRAA